MVCFGCTLFCVLLLSVSLLWCTLLRYIMFCQCDLLICPLWTKILWVTVKNGIVHCIVGRYCRSIAMPIFDDTSIVDRTILFGITILQSITVLMMILLLVTYIFYCVQFSTTCHFAIYPFSLIYLFMPCTGVTRESVSMGHRTSKKVFKFNFLD